MLKTDKIRDKFMVIVNAISAILPDKKSAIYEDALFYPKVIALCAIIFSRLFFYIIILIVGILIGILWKASYQEDVEIQEYASNMNALKTPFESPTPDIPPIIKKPLRQLVAFIVRDFINGWYCKLNHSLSEEFPNAVQSGLEEVFYSLGFAFAHANPVHLLLKLLQSLNSFTREYRNFEESQLSLDSYLIEYPKSKFNSFSDRQKIMDQLRDISMRATISLLPRGDRSSVILFSILREILATTVFLPVIERKFCNVQLIYNSILNAIREKTTSELKMQLEASRINQLDVNRMDQLQITVESKDQGQQFTTLITLSELKPNHSIKLEKELGESSALLSLELLLMDPNHYDSLDEDTEIPPPLTQRSRTSSGSPIITVQKVLESPDAMIEFMQHLDPSRARYVSLFMMIEAFKKMWDKETISILQEYATKILDQYFSKSMLDFGNRPKTVEIVQKIESEISHNLSSNVFDPLAELIFQYLDPDLRIFTKSPIYQSLKFEQSNTLLTENSKAERKNSARLKMIQSAFDNAQKAVKLVDFQISIASPENLAELLELKFNSQNQMDELTDLEALEESDPFDIVIDLKNVYCELKRQNDLNSLFTNDSYILVFSNEDERWTRLATYQDFQRLYNDILKQFSRIESFYFPRKIKFQLEAWINKVIHDPVFSLYPPVINFVTFQEDYDDEDIGGILSGALKSTTRAINSVTKETTKAITSVTKEAGNVISAAGSAAESMANSGIHFASTGISQASSLMSSSGFGSLKKSDDFIDEAENLLDHEEEGLGIVDIPARDPEVPDVRESVSILEESLEAEVHTISSKDVEMILDVAISSLEELFHQDSPTRWIRQQGLGLIKLFVKKSYGKNLEKNLQKQYDELLQLESVASRIDSINNTIWPNGRKWGTGPPPPEFQPKEEYREAIIQLLKNGEYKEFKLKPEVSRIISSLSTILGREAVMKGVERTLNMMDHPILMSGLACKLLDNIFKHALRQ